jgi:hypothetical protein
VTKKTDNPDGKPLLCQRIFSSVFHAVFFYFLTAYFNLGCMGPFRVTLCFMCVSTEASKLVYGDHFYTQFSKKKKKSLYLFYSQLICILTNCKTIKKTAYREAAFAQTTPSFPMRYKPEGRGFDSRRCHWNFSLT